MGFAFGAEDVMASVAVEKKAILSETKSGIFEKLRRLRLAIAREEHVPPFVVFSDATLEDMVSRLPRTEEEMAEVHGIGAFKLKKYGERFLAALGEFSGAEEMRGKDEREEKTYMRNSNGSAALWQKRKSVDITNSFRYSPPSDRRNLSGNRRGIPRCERYRPEKADKYAEVFCKPFIRNGAVFPQKQKVKCRKKRTCHSQNGKTRPWTERENHSGTKGNDSGWTDGGHRHRNKSVFPLSEKSKSAACQRNGPVGGKHLCRQGFRKDGEKRNRV